MTINQITLFRFYMHGTILVNRCSYPTIFSYFVLTKKKKKNPLHKVLKAVLESPLWLY